jgi:hypothetical protein
VPFEVPAGLDDSFPANAHSPMVAFHCELNVLVEVKGKLTTDRYKASKLVNVGKYNPNLVTYDVHDPAILV